MLISQTLLHNISIDLVYAYLSDTATQLLWYVDLVHVRLLDTAAQQLLFCSFFYAYSSLTLLHNNCIHFMHAGLSDECPTLQLHRFGIRASLKQLPHR